MKKKWKRYEINMRMSFVTIHPSPTPMVFGMVSGMAPAFSRVLWEV